MEPIAKRRRRRKTNRTRKPTWRTIWHSLILNFLELPEPEQAAFLARLEAEGRGAHARRYRRMGALVKAGRWEPIHDKDFKEQKARKGDTFLRVPKAAVDRLVGPEIGEDSGPEKDPLEVLNFFLPSGRRGGQFLKDKKTGNWVEADALLVADFLQELEQERCGFYYDEKLPNGRVSKKWKKLQVSKESLAWAIEHDEEIPTPTPLSTLEVQAPPMVVLMLKYFFADQVAAGVPVREAEDRTIALFRAARPALLEYFEWRTGQKVVVPFEHLDSGKFHFGFYSTRIELDEAGDLRQIGLPQLGTGGAVDVGLNSQLWAGYQMPADLFATVRRRMLHMMDSQTKPSKVERAKARGATLDGRWTDIGLSEELMMFFFRKDAEMGWGYWDRACAEYRAALVVDEARKSSSRALKKELRDSAARMLLADAEKAKLAARDLRLEERIPEVREALEEGLAESGLTGVEHREAMRAVTAEFSLKRLAEATLSVLELARRARQGLEKLLEWLRDLFKVSAPEVVKPVLEVVEAAPAAENPEPLRSWRKALADAGREPGPEFAAVIANVEAGREWEDGLTGEMWIAAQTEMVSLGLIEEDALAVSRAVLTPAPAQTQDNALPAPPPAKSEPVVEPEIEPVPTLSEEDEAGFEKPVGGGLGMGIRRQNFTRLARRWQDPTLPTRAQSVANRVEHALALVQSGRLTEASALELLETAPFGSFVQVCTQVVRGKSVASAIDFVEQEKPIK
jgi:hypothetical protein